jgi:uncharacterized protein YegP (UPF0339 family)
MSDTGKYVIKTSGDQFSFSLKAGGNSEIILTSERYTRKSSALDGITALRVNAGVDAHYERRTSVAKEPYFVLKAGNGEILGTSEMYSSNAAREDGIEAVKRNAPSASVVDHS